MGQTLQGCRIGGVDGIDNGVCIANTTIGNLPGIIHLINIRAPVVLMQVDICITPADTNTSRNHILVSAFLKSVIHAEPVFYQVAILCGGGTEQQREVGLVREVDVSLVETVI